MLPHPPDRLFLPVPLPFRCLVVSLYPSSFLSLSPSLVSREGGERGRERERQRRICCAARCLFSSEQLSGKSARNFSRVSSRVTKPLPPPLVSSFPSSITKGDNVRSVRFDARSSFIQRDREISLKVIR